MKPLSAAYYVKENKGRALVILFLLFLTASQFLAGNYVNSVYYFWDAYMNYSDQLATVTALSTDENFSEFAEFTEDLMADDALIVMPRSPRAHRGLPWDSTMGFTMGTVSMVFNSPEDLRLAFEKLGIEGDFSKVEDQTIVISTAMAKQYGLDVGDIVDGSVKEGFPGSYRISALTTDDSFVVFYVDHDDTEPALRLNVIGKELTGQALRDHIDEIRAGRKAEVEKPIREEIDQQFVPCHLIFGAGIAILTVILAVIVNSVITGQFIARTYEFGVYRAIGLSKRTVYFKVARELLFMDAIAMFCGVVTCLIFTFLMNELLYIPTGKYLPYYSAEGMRAFLISNLLVVVPTILLKGRAMSKSNVTEF